MQFYIKIKWNGRTFGALVIRVNHDRTKESFDVVGRNKTVIVESNRPMLILKRLDNWKPTYKITSGRFNSPGFDDALIKAVHEGIIEFEKRTPSCN